MINLSIFNFCDWWWLWWFLPFLLGLLLGWAIWAKWRRMYEEAQNEIKGYQSKIKGLEEDLEACRKKGSDYASEIATLKGTIRERNNEISSLKSSATGSVKAAIPVAAPIAPVNTTVAAAPATPASANISSAKADKYAKLKSDNLQIIEGIGPKMESVMHENGVHTWTELGGKTNDDLRGILDKYGDKYRIIDPSDWPAQAKLASSGNWDGLISLQKGLGSQTGAETDSKVEKVMIKLGILKQWKDNDLKAVEGIGPKIESLLNNSGITTWVGLSQTPVEKLNSILAAAGDRYKLADPGTWPKQAQYAADGMWDELEEYQDFLQGGKDPG